MFDETHDPATAMRQRRQEAEAQIRAKELRKVAQGHVLMAGFEAYGNGMNGKGLFAKVNTAAKWGLIWFAMIAPILLVIDQRW
ncbi:hypothetical protein PM03_02300 [Thalassobacter stenotrophicus]|jgi:hypothetical protein|uniref:Uncharacterized protein n=2 Tax=Thalassobacter stenotrophicus TaxID=266809 RepID=A0A0P1F315_9RHOB|nr:MULTISPECIES: hypothetical protein [Thalassobacter]KGK80782.1 hypothetical protein PM03_02300 [Thalassobacter stenotrophicus]KGL02166.1 hypothetical protein PM04_06325 [Thalassobacter sp. 16PALIMAR09]PVZ48959.1 hypothetical protein DD557_09560 [Thalassobacter stenotrophicus]CUH62065.1 hypothetical protein THS5294_03379 [Thalassobacter stenotrophicus]SHI35718.1 hypothetical protein SAMN02744035_00253 [Thalassobacter stenotrophicus DSM 16310]